MRLRIEGMEPGLQEPVVAGLSAPDCRLAYRHHGGAGAGIYPSGRPPDGSTFEQLPANPGSRRGGIETDRSRPAGFLTQNRQGLLPDPAVPVDGTNQAGPVPIPVLHRAGAAPLWS